MTCRWRPKSLKKSMLRIRISGSEGGLTSRKKVSSLSFLQKAQMIAYSRSLINSKSSKMTSRSK